MANPDCPFNVNDDCCFDDEVVVDRINTHTLEINGVQRHQNLTFVLISAPFPATSPYELLANNIYYVDVDNQIVTNQVFELPSVASSTLGDKIIFEQTSDQLGSGIARTHTISTSDGSKLRKTSMFNRIAPATNVGVVGQGPCTDVRYIVNWANWATPSTMTKLVFIAATNGGAGKGARSVCTFLSDLDGTTKGQWEIVSSAPLQGLANVSDTSDFQV